MDDPTLLFLKENLISRCRKMHKVLLLAIEQSKESPGQLLSATIRMLSNMIQITCFIGSEMIDRKFSFNNLPEHEVLLKKSYAVMDNAGSLVHSMTNSILPKPHKFYKGKCIGPKLVDSKFTSEDCGGELHSHVLCSYCCQLLIHKSNYINTSNSAIVKTDALIKQGYELPFGIPIIVTEEYSLILLFPNVDLLELNTSLGHVYRLPGNVTLDLFYWPLHGMFTAFKEIHEMNGFYDGTNLFYPEKEITHNLIERQNVRDLQFLNKYMSIPLIRLLACSVIEKYISHNKLFGTESEIVTEFLQKAIDVVKLDMEYDRDLASEILSRLQTHVCV